MPLPHHWETFCILLCGCIFHKLRSLISFATTCFHMPTDCYRFRIFYNGGYDGHGNCTTINPRSHRCTALPVLFIQLATPLTSNTNCGTTTAAYRIEPALQNLFPLMIVVSLLFAKGSPTPYFIHGDDDGAEQSL